MFFKATIRRPYLALLLAVSFIFQSCQSADQKNASQTQLQIREFQTRSYETKDTASVLKAVLNVLQDDGFIIKSADSNLGYLTGSKELNIGNRSSALGKTILRTAIFGLAALDTSWEKSALLEATANVSAFGAETRVRVNFQRKTLDNSGNALELGQIQNAAFYQAFFAKVDKGIFISRENL